MRNILVIDSAATGDASVSRALTDQFVARMVGRDRSLRVVRRDIGREPIPHLTEETVFTIRGKPAETGAEQRAIALSDALIDEIRDAELIVIGAPMYNFGMPSTLKAWFDHVLRARVTFRYSESGPEGLMTGKKAVVIESRAGLYSEGPSAVMDHQEPHIRTLLGFMGIDDVTFVRAEKLAFGEDVAEASKDEARETLARIAGDELRLAA